MDHPDRPSPPSIEQDPAQPESKQSLPHSGFGIASFVMSLTALALAILTTFLLVPVAVEWTQISDPNMAAREPFPNPVPPLILAPFLLAAVALITLIGGILGIVGLARKNTKKVFAVLGVVFNFVYWALFFLMLLLVLIVQSTV